MNFSDFKGNFKQLNDLKSFLKNQHGVMLIVGECGTGKTTIYELLKNQNKYDILYLNDSNFSEVATQNFIQCKTIVSFFTKLEKIVYIDDIDIITNFNKQFIANLNEYKTKCKIILTVKSKEEKKITASLKKIVDIKIYLNKLDYKECFQVLLRRFQDRTDIDQSRLLELIKAQKCNIANVIMLIDNVTSKQEDISILNENMDIFHSNIYNIVENIYTKKLSYEYINSLSSKDNSIIASMVHENVTNINTNINTYLKLYDVMSYCDKLDKHIYINCLWGTNWDMLNLYRFSNMNNILSAVKNPQFTVNFTQQFTKLSSQVSMKKKLQQCVYTIYLTNILDLLYHLTIKQYDDIQNNKVIKELVIKFKKDFSI